MVRPRCLKSDPVFDAVGDAALLCLALPLVALLLLGLLALAAVDVAHERRWLGPCTAGLLVAFAVVALVGCTSPATPVHDPRDPAVWRPTTPANYPMPR